jgi:5S rRNA maturation endonuclease (ribonuclease M5)
MSKQNHYKWLIVVEGDTDVETYSQLLKRYDVNADDFAIFSATGKGNVCKASNWDRITSTILETDNLLSTLLNDIGRYGFSGVILIVDSDAEGGTVFDAYERNPKLQYSDSSVPTKENRENVYWILDFLTGVNNIPVIGISVPMGSDGCLETDLLSSYGFPMDGQLEYRSFVNIIKIATSKWNVPQLSGGRDW